MSTFLGWLVGIAVAIVCSISVVNYSNAQWQHQITYRSHHPVPGWKIESGTITATGHPDFYQSPPQTPGTVSFQDFFGHWQTAQRNFVQYPLQIGTRVRVDVNQDGTVYVPMSYEDGYAYNGTWKGPEAAYAGFYPGVADFLGVILSGIVGSIVGAIAHGIFELLGGVPSLAGRLGAK